MILKKVFRVCCICVIALVFYHMISLLVVNKIVRQIRHSVSLHHKPCKYKYLPYEPLVMTIAMSNTTQQVESIYRSVKLCKIMWFFSMRCNYPKIQSEYTVISPNTKRIPEKKISPSFPQLSKNFERLISDNSSICCGEREKYVIDCSFDETGVYKVKPSLYFCRSEGSKVLIKELPIFNIIVEKPSFDIDIKIWKLFESGKLSNSFLFAFFGPSIFTSSTNAFEIKRNFGESIKDLVEKCPFDFFTEDALINTKSVYLDYIRYDFRSWFNSEKVIKITRVMQKDFPLLRDHYVSRYDIIEDLLQKTHLSAFDKELLSLNVCFKAITFDEIYDFEKGDIKPLARDLILHSDNILTNMTKRLIKSRSSKGPLVRPDPFWP